MGDYKIPYEDWGGQGPILHYAHANAYPPGTYRQLLTQLSRDFRVLAVKHRPLWPESYPEEIYSWQDIAKDMISFLDQMKINGVIGVGHSLGAVTTMMAAFDRPDLFYALVLIEPIFLLPAILAHFTEQESIDPYDLPLVKIALKRRHHWVTRQGAFEYFRRKRVFARWSNETLWDYVSAGLGADSNGEFELVYPPAWEAWIYAHLPTTVWDIIPQVTHPTLGLRGIETDTLSRKAWDMWLEKQPRATFIEVAEAGHLLPMEEPFTVADMTRNFLRNLL